MNRAELYTAGVRHALDWLGKWVAQLEATTLSLNAPDAALAQAWLWRLPETAQEVFLESEEDKTLSLPEKWPIALRREPAFTQPPLTVLPFTLDIANPPFRSEHILGCFHNATSYRRLRHSGEPCRSLGWLRRKARQEGYRLYRTIGVYPPAFLWRLALSMLLERTIPSLADFWRQRAYEHLSTAQSLPVQFSSIVVFHACRIHGR